MILVEYRGGSLGDEPAGIIGKGLGEAYQSYIVLMEQMLVLPVIQLIASEPTGRVDNDKIEWMIAPCRVSYHLLEFWPQIGFRRFAFFPVDRTYFPAASLGMFLCQ
nr:hypothetical protein [Neorhizobium galegae]